MVSFFFFGNPVGCLEKRKRMSKEHTLLAGKKMFGADNKTPFAGSLLSSERGRSKDVEKAWLRFWIIFFCHHRYGKGRQRCRGGRRLFTDIQIGLAPSRHDYVWDREVMGLKMESTLSKKPADPRSRTSCRWRHCHFW